MTDSVFSQVSFKLFFWVCNKQIKPSCISPGSWGWRQLYQTFKLIWKRSDMDREDSDQFDPETWNIQLYKGWVVLCITNWDLGWTSLWCQKLIDRILITFFDSLILYSNMGRMSLVFLLYSLGLIYHRWWYFCICSWLFIDMCLVSEYFTVSQVMRVKCLYKMRKYIYPGGCDLNDDSFVCYEFSLVLHINVFLVMSLSYLFWYKIYYFRYHACSNYHDLVFMCAHEKTLTMTLLCFDDIHTNLSTG